MEGEIPLHWKILFPPARWGWALLGEGGYPRSDRLVWVGNAGDHKRKIYLGLNPTPTWGKGEIEGKIGRGEDY